MSQPAFSQDWLQQFTDPYAVLGLSVVADERRILKRYRQVAKQLHPDVQRHQSGEDQAFVHQVLSKLVNPAYQRLKQDNGRKEVLATLRFKVRRLAREERLDPHGDLARQLLVVPEAEVEVFYEQALTDLSTTQYQSTESFASATQHIAELNLIYLRRKMGDAVIREKRTGLVAAHTVTNAPVPTPSPSQAPRPPVSYAERHFSRAKDYIAAKNYPPAIQELKDALKLEPKNSSYHCLIGQVYLLQKLPGMAKVHIKQTLRLNPDHAVALKYARMLKLDLSTLNGATPHPGSPPSSVRTSSASPPRKLFGKLFSR